MDRVLLFTEEPILATGLASIMAAVPDIELQITVGSASSLPEVVQTNRTELLIVDFEPEQFGILVELRKRTPNCKIVLWVRSMSREMAFQVMHLGIRGILRRTVALEVVVKCVRAVAAGELWFDREHTTWFLEARTVVLTPRETQLVALVSEGLKNKEVAAALGIADSTVRIYLSSLFRKLCVRDRYELAIYGMRHMMPGPAVPGREEQEHSRSGYGTKGQTCPRFLLLDRNAGGPTEMVLNKPRSVRAKRTRAAAS